MASKILLSLIVPTRDRCEQLLRLLRSLADTADDLARIEVVLVIDEDDTPGRNFTHDRVQIRKAPVPPVSTMGALNRAGYNASTGDFLMLLNDDVVARTPGWDSKILACLQTCPDQFVLVHVNDTLMKTALCTFPIVSRKYCEMAGGICPVEYVRYRIDDHIEDVFNMLGVLGQQRTLYLPKVIFEHDNYVEQDGGLRQYFSDEKVLAIDAPIFDSFSEKRKQLALRLMSMICGEPNEPKKKTWAAKLDQISDPFALRVPERLRFVDDFSEKNLKALSRRIARGKSDPPNYEYLPVPSTRSARWHARMQRLQKHFQKEGLPGLFRLLCRKVTQRLGRRARPNCSAKIQSTALD